MNLKHRKENSMTKYIDKDAVVAEINRQKDGCYKICAGNFDFLKTSYPELITLLKRMIKFSLFSKPLK